MNTLTQSILEADSYRLEVFQFDGEVRCRLAELWEEQETSDAPPGPSEHRPIEVDDSARFSLAVPQPSEWALAFTPTFKKAIATVDRKLQGRILTAVSEMPSEPLSPHGDTVKPLTGEYKGLWRYRLGDYRLIYRPTVEVKRVVCSTLHREVGLRVRPNPFEPTSLRGAA
jgi:mRNA-degrading endonuclease RelE of RelBE toxin-antitoxin system